MSDLQILALTVAWTWLGLILASLNRSRSWTLAGLRVAFGYRDDVPPSTTFSRRLDRISNNMLRCSPPPSSAPTWPASRRTAWSGLPGCSSAPASPTS